MVWVVLALHSPWAFGAVFLIALILHMREKQVMAVRSNMPCFQDDSLGTSSIHGSCLSIRRAPIDLVSRRLSGDK